MSGATRNFRDAEIWVTDGSPTPKTMMIKLSEGDFAFSKKNNSFTVMNRGKIDSRKQGDETTLDVNFTMKFEQWAFDMGVTGLSPMDILDGTDRAIAAGWVSTDECGPWAITVELRIKNPCAPANYEKLAFNKVHFDSLDFKEGNEYNTVAAKGTALQNEVDSEYVTP